MATSSRRIRLKSSSHFNPFYGHKFVWNDYKDCFLPVMSTIVQEQVAEVQVLETVVMEPQPDVAIATAGAAPIAPVYDNEALKAIVQQAFQNASDPNRMVTDAVIERITSRIRGYIPSNDGEFYKNVLGSNSFQSHLESVVRRLLGDTDFHSKTQQEVTRYLENEAQEIVQSLTVLELDNAARRIAGSNFLESYRSRLVSDLERVATEMRQEKNAATLLATAVSPQLHELAKAHLQAEAGASIEAISERIKRLAAKEQAVGILGNRLPIRRATQDKVTSRYYVEGLNDLQVPTGLYDLFLHLSGYGLLQELSTPIQQAPTNQWLNFANASMPLGHLVYLMEKPTGYTNRRNGWPLVTCSGPDGAVDFLQHAADVMSILDAIFGSKSMSMAPWCALPIVNHVNSKTRLGLHLLSYGIRVSLSKGEAVQIRGSDFKPIPLNLGFAYTAIHVLDE